MTERVQEVCLLLYYFITLLLYYFTTLLLSFGDPYLSRTVAGSDLQQTCIEICVGIAATLLDLVDSFSFSEHLIFLEI